MKDAYVKFMLATVIYGTNGIIASHIPLSSYEIVLTRTVLGSLFLMVLTTFRHEWSTLHQMTPREWLLLVLAGVFLGGNWIFLYEAYQHIGVSLATLLCYIGPILIMILSRFVFKEPFTLPKVTAMILVTLGIMAINGADFKAHGLSWGVACGFLGAVCFALLIIVMKKAKPMTGFFSPACQLVVASLLVGAVTYTIPTPAVDLTLQDLSYMAILGIINTGLGYALYFTGVQRLSAQSVSICGYFEPFTALLLSALILGEILTPMQWLGAVLILGGVALSELWHPRKKRQEAL
ncbi:DMT family transporter [Megasphaera massiliensis]|uniref:DMT family transporter n=1 Tax=Megasphaera massiliensis TaxID=1232428 RepID=UPI0004240CC3|nr:DMT family transporter [Megasphaera massiliensis]MBS6255576.1 EamA family transporter [Megasphaera sp.]MCQ5209551.1 DMT family transporter [Megasphaera massiliensis]MEE0659053.1 DMT family transporter [Megasphaera massiliensis]